MAGKALRLRQASVQVHYIYRAGAFMQVIDILSDHRYPAAGASQTRRCEMSSIGFGLAYLLSSP
ncbi:hypothetical protein D3C78_1888440 [compost metagenome]